MKGRSVLLGDNVKDQDFNWAEFCELGSSPPSIEAAKALDAMGSLPGYKVKTGDARGAYTQSLLRGTETWATLPEHRWPKQWRHNPAARRPINVGTLRPHRRRMIRGRTLRRKALAHRIYAPRRRVAGCRLA